MAVRLWVSVGLYAKLDLSISILPMLYFIVDFHLFIDMEQNSADSRGKARQTRPRRSEATRRLGARPQESGAVLRNIGSRI